MNRRHAAWTGLIVSMALIPALCHAQGSNSGATLNATFTPNPPTIDGQVSPGEWDNAGVTTGAWTSHDSTAAADATEPTVVKVMYDVFGLYILFDRTDKNVECGATGTERLQDGPSHSPYYTPGSTVGWDFAGQDYIAIYVDPAATGVDLYSYSIQVEPSMSVLGPTAVDHLGNSYTYTEVGQFGGLKARFADPETELGLSDPLEWDYWAGGVSWDLTDSKIADGLRAGGFYVEFFIPWTDLNSYYDAYGSEIIDEYFVEANGLPYEPGYGLVKQPSGNLTGMPAPGTEWEIQFGVHSGSMTGAQYVNWVGDTGGFATRPFGKLVFGDAPAAQVAAQITAFFAADGQVHLEWEGPAGATHLVQASDQAGGEWTTIETIESAPAQNSIVLAMNDNSARFFRVLVQ